MINNKFVIAIGNIFPHPKFINCGYVTLGTATLTHIYIIIIIGAHSPPPKNSIPPITPILNI
jgi:hypothetical protein